MSITKPITETRTISTQAIPADLTEQARLMVTELFTPWAEQFPGAVVTYCRQTVDPLTGKYGPFGADTSASIADPEAMVRAIRTSDPYEVSWTNSQVQQRPPTSGRGDASCHDGYTALIIDADTRRSKDSPELPTGHKAHESTGLPLPTLSEAGELIRRVSDLIGVEPTAVVKTSDEGLHAWWRLDELIPKDSPIIERWKAFVVGEFFAAGVHIDAAVLADVPRVLRLPGQWRTKLNNRHGSKLSAEVKATMSPEELEQANQRPIVTVPQQAVLAKWNPGNIARVAELDQLLPANTQVTMPGKPSKPGKSKRTGKGEWEPSTAPLDHRLPVLALMGATLDGEFTVGDGMGDGDEFKWCNSASPASARQEHHATSGEWCAFVHSDTMQGDLDLDVSQGRKFTATSYIREVLTDDRTTARRLIDHLSALDEDEALEWVGGNIAVFGGGDVAEWKRENRRTIARVLTDTAAAVPVVPQAARVTEPVLTITAETDTSTPEPVVTATVNNTSAPVEAPEPVTEPVVTRAIAESIRTLDGERYEAGWGLFAIIGGDKHGLYRTDEVVLKKDGKAVLDEDGEPVTTKAPKLLTDVVVVRTERVHTVGESEDGDTYTVEVVGPRSGGFRRRTLTGVAADKSADIKHLIAEAAVGGHTPEDTLTRERCRNLINKLGPW